MPDRHSPAPNSRRPRYERARPRQPRRRPSLDYHAEQGPTQHVHDPRPMTSDEREKTPPPPKRENHHNHHGAERRETRRKVFVIRFSSVQNPAPVATGRTSARRQSHAAEDSADHPFRRPSCPRGPPQGSAGPRVLPGATGTRVLCVMLSRNGQFLVGLRGYAHRPDLRLNDERI